MRTDYDIVIVGGGLVGASLARVLSNQALHIAVIEAVPLISDSQPSYDDRSIALAYGARRIFESTGLWNDLTGSIMPIKRIHVSDLGCFGVTRLDAAREHVDALGYVVENRVMGKLFGTTLTTQKNIELRCPAKLTGLDFGPHAAGVTINENDSEYKLTAKLVIGADGGNSLVRKLTGGRVRRWDYGQTAIIGNVTPGQPHNNIAYERFTDSGPLALLPMTENRCSLVWTARNADVDRIMALDDKGFLDALQQRFGYRLGIFRKVGKRHAYPLTLNRVDTHVLPRVALIGNAAHTLHPVAGQGFNLGLRDVAVLAETVVDALRAGQDIGDLTVLNRYASWRRGDQRRVIAFTDGLVRVFSNPLLPVVCARNLGLLAVDILPSAKHLLTRQTMGLAGRQTRLARGLPL